MKAVTVDVVDSQSLRAASVLAARRVLQRRLPVTVTVLSGRVVPPSAEDTARLQDLFGTRSGPFATHMFDAVCKLTRREGRPGADQRGVNAALAFIGGTEPRNELDAMAATLLYAANNAALRLLERGDADNAAAIMASAAASLAGALTSRPASVSSDWSEKP